MLVTNTPGVLTDATALVVLSHVDYLTVLEILAAIGVGAVIITVGIGNGGLSMKFSHWAGIVFASCAPAVAEAQYTVQWAAPAAVTSATAYFPMGTPLQLTTRIQNNDRGVANVCYRFGTRCRNHQGR